MNEPLDKARARVPERLRAMKWRRWLRPIVSRRSSPEAIALGFSIGLAVAFTPTLGFQILLAYLIATFLRANRAAAIIPVWITTPVTVPPIFAFTYRIGTYVVPGPSVGRVRADLVAFVKRLDRHSIFDLPAHIAEFLKIGGEVFIPMMIGGVIVGLVAGMISYPCVLWAVRRYRAHRQHARQKRKDRRAEKRVR